MHGGGGASRLGGGDLVRRTSIALLVTLAILAGVIGWLGQVALTASGSATVVPPLTLTAGLIAVALVVVGFAWPIRQAVRGKRDRAVDPFFAMRVLVLSKACSLVGSLLTGAGAGVLLYDLSRTVPPPVPTLVAVIGAAVGAVCVVVAGLLVESWLRIPPSDDTEVEPERGLQHN